MNIPEYIYTALDELLEEACTAESASYIGTLRDYDEARAALAYKRDQFIELLRGLS